MEALLIFSGGVLHWPPSPPSILYGEQASRYASQLKEGKSPESSRWTVNKGNPVAEKPTGSDSTKAHRRTAVKRRTLGRTGAKKWRFYGAPMLSITVKGLKVFVLNENKIAGHGRMDSSGGKGGAGEGIVYFIGSR